MNRYAFIVFSIHADFINRVKRIQQKSLHRNELPYIVFFGKLRSIRKVKMQVKLYSR
jgi:hypothetical protein